MSDDTYHDSAPSFSSPISSPNRTTSPGLDYEQSQHKQPARDAREAAMSEEERAEAAEQRARKRQRLYDKQLELYFKPEGWSPASIPRSTAIEAAHVINGFFAPGQALDSQTGSQTYVESLYRLTDDRESQTQPEAAETKFENSQQSESEHDSDHELHIQVELLQKRATMALTARDAMEKERDEYRDAYHKAREELRAWKDAAAAASSLINLSLPYTTKK
ncbi:hypothetical protein C8R44DRAFT_885782 [Mycena epipterygia]|nr:hypothetical protein C8R44DRAFT_885782 [Mycena epipterygia]